MRVTQGMLSQQMLYDIQGNNQRLSKLQNEAATGKKINSPADDPIGVGFVMQYKNDSAYDAQYQNNATTAQGVLSYTDSAMSEAGQVMQRARDLAVQGSTGTLTANDRQDMAAEVDQLSKQLVAIGNSEFNQQYIFGGQQTSAAPYPANNPQNVTTDNGHVMYDLGDGVSLNVNVPGNAFFGQASDANNAFAVLSQLKTALQNNDVNTIGSSISAIDSRSSAMMQAQSQIGALSDRAQLMQTRMADMAQNVQGLLANAQDADMAKVITDLNSATAVQTASLQVGARTIQPTLLDFLK